VYSPSKSPVGSVFATFRNINKNRILLHSVFVFMIQAALIIFLNVFYGVVFLINTHGLCSFGREN